MWNVTEGSSEEVMRTEGSTGVEGGGGRMNGGSVPGRGNKQHVQRLEARTCIRDLKN